MSYISFARKYRPQTFDDIIGQSHVITTLKNAISQDRVAHAYLFSGPRGVGKTTAARILAKALNCEKGPTPKPCNACAACKEITQGSFLDILEIDGASNRGIDEIRNLRDNVKFSPAKGKFKVYIIDEVHMLTPEAFNALLKTLEEPPQHVKFIFATTQAHKVPPTILSRCQRFDFRRIGAKEIANNLKKIVKQEGLNIDEEALGLIAKYSDGGMRDAQVMLDQITSFTNLPIGAKDVTKILGMVEDEALFELSSAIRNKDAARALGILDTLTNEGKDIPQIALGLIEHFRNITITKISKDIDSLIDAGAEKVRRYRDEGAGWTIEEALYIIYTLANAIDLIKKSNLAKIPLEAALVKLTLSHSVFPLKDLIKRVEALETSLGAKNEIASSLTSFAPRNDEGSRIFRPPAVAAPKSADLKEVIGAWSAIISSIMLKKMSVASYLQEGYPVSVSDKVLLIGFPKELQFHKEVLESPDNKAIIEEAIKTVLGKELKAEFILTEPENTPPRRPGYSGTNSSDIFEQKEDEALKKEDDPILKTAMEIFGGDIAHNPRIKRKAG